MKTWFAIPLWQRVLGALLLGLVAGLLLGAEAERIKWVGDLFIRAIKMLVVPLVFFSLIAGVTAIGDLAKLRKVGSRAVLLFLITGITSVAIGLTLGTVFAPGIGLGFTIGDPANLSKPTAPSITDMIISIVPENPIASMADAQILPIIVFAMLTGIGILLAGKAGEPVARVADSAAIVMQKMTMIVMELTPFGVFALIAWVAGSFGFQAMLPLAKVVGLSYLGYGLIILVVYPMLIRGIAKLPLIDFFRGIVDSQAIAFSTASSNAALPVTLRCVEKNLGVTRSVSSFTVALGATINMNGTAVYLGVVTLFGAQIFGIDLSWTDYFLVGITATLGAIGAAGIPGSGLIMMSLVFSAVGVPLETIAFIAGVDRIMDMGRTMTNVTGDAAVAVTVGKMTDEIDVEEYRSNVDI